MNTQVHEATCACPYELVFGQKPRSVLFPVEKQTGVILEEELEREGVICEDEKQETISSMNIESPDECGSDDEEEISLEAKGRENQEEKQVDFQMDGRTSENENEEGKVLSDEDNEKEEDGSKSELIEFTEDGTGREMMGDEENNSNDTENESAKDEVVIVREKFQENDAVEKRKKLENGGEGQRMREETLSTTIKHKQVILPYRFNAAMLSLVFVTV